MVPHTSELHGGYIEVTARLAYTALKGLCSSINGIVAHHPLCPVDCSCGGAVQEYHIGNCAHYVNGFIKEVLVSRRDSVHQGPVKLDGGKRTLVLVMCS